MAPDLCQSPELASNNADGRTLTILGCGVFGTAILAGLVSRSLEHNIRNDTTSAESESPVPFRRYIACVRRRAAADAIKEKLAHHREAPPVSVLVNDNLRGVDQADAVLLAVQPHMVESLLAQAGLSQLLAEKLIISVVAGVSSSGLEAYLQANIERSAEVRSSIIRAIPNTACVIHKSTTVIERPTNVPQSSINLTEALFRCVGQTFFAEGTEIDVCTAICGSTPAFLTLILEGLVDGAVSMGLNHVDALQLASDSMLGTASMVLHGLQPYEIRHDVASPGGSTIQGVLALEKGSVRAQLAEALRSAASAASLLGVKQTTKR